MAKVKIRPVPGKVLVRQIDQESDYSGSRYMSSGNEEAKPKKGTVVRLPHPVSKVTSKECAVSEAPPISLKEGDVIFYRCYGSDIIEYNDVEYSLISNYDIMAKVE